MLGAVLLFGVLAGIDNLQVCSSIGLLPMEGRRRHVLAAAFSLCETAAPLLGLALGHWLLRWLTGAAKAGPLLMLVSGGVVLAGALRKDEGSDAASGRGMLFGLPLSLSLDNLVGGAGISALEYPMVPAALVIGVVSAAMSCGGLYLGGWLRQFLERRFAWCGWLSRSWEPAVGAYLCLLAVRLLIANRS